ncbi:NAD(P)/FAD-dependent oxidoreductase [Paraburkholderia sp. JPY432]|uniref:NAD(P)/FAD-dependent oxidoreductase n=1 Tax=Paraburkholderia youngii TaxID=2782701 RepID=UPI00159500D3|nr:NAD(P)/FAD-dependent oxidoreductase [Paraburkholderia youngii]NVH77653.1 NAD(P)/FAD-dependent oxidoreductase [Paraburkholderia youngii]
MHRIVIVGGGAGGLELATRLSNRFGLRKHQRERNVCVTLVDRHPAHIWKPLLHKVAAGSMSPAAHELSYAAQGRWHGFDFQQGELVGLSRSSKQVMLGAVRDDQGAELLPQRALDYDTLVIAIGSTTQYFGVDGAARHAIALESVDQAERFHRRFIEACSRAGAARGSENGALAPRMQVVIVGAGATGVELSAELRDAACELSQYGLHDLDPTHDVGIVVIEAGPRILPALPERVARATAERLGQLGVTLMVGESVARVLPGSVLTGSGKRIRADLTVWSAGVTAPPVLSLLDGLNINRRGQLVVRDTLQSETDEDVFALGDCAACEWPGKSGGVPPRAQAAHQQAAFLVEALTSRVEGKTLRQFRYRDFGSLVSLSRFGAVGNLVAGSGEGLYVAGLVARGLHTSLERMHVAALYGIRRMVLDTMANWLRRSTNPRIKLH